MQQRIPLPAKLQRQILVKNKHCCCICQKDGYGKEVIIHHIDGNNSNNVISNLAILCLIHSSMADASLSKGKLGSGKKLSQDEVKEFKRIWERKIEEEGKILKVRVPINKRKELETLYLFEINNTKNKILSYRDTDHRIEEAFKYLDQLVIEEFVSGLKLRRILFKAYSDITLQSIESNNITKRVAKSFWGLFLHLVGPHYVKISDEDKKLFLDSINSLEILGEWSAEFSSNESTLNGVCSIIHDFAEIASWYNLLNEKKKILSILNKMLKACNEYEKESKSIRNIKSRLKRKEIIKKIKDKISNIEKS